MIKLLFEIKQLVLLIIRVMYSILENGYECVVCGNRTVVIPVCRKCKKKYFNIHERLSVTRCELCGKELISNKNICSECKENPVLQNTSTVLPLFSYRLWNKELLYLWKIKEERSLSVLFSSFLNQALGKIGEKIIVPVPPRKGKIQKNGWDQIEELCQFLEKRYGYTILRILERKSVKQQKKLNREERLQTIKNAYSFVNGKKFLKELKKVKGKIPPAIVLLDDVCTTGSTIECCSELLKKRGVESVKVITLFTVD